MSDINRRINTIERLLSVGQHTKLSQPPMIFCVRSKSESTVDPEGLGSVETWITYQEQLQARQEANTEYLKNNPYGLPEIIVIELDAGKEYQAREQQKAKQ